ncbi:response regulator transcription factor [Herbiconiux sp. CPCC 203407]|uniref:Response regulator transcription factor n=1 Tax=Herbiconiux oxytropis TaxID=2970915 RepID=A0AA41XHS6_9MICO|nr:response regulator transcription factor [Herbiconiux oxytropis]MCS5722957.1 response regulator transcription factor [Herbiconiux oxytropis]MCS5725231.1 response regulator transcription factor [Herbiconiux oxytropis]
MTDETPGRIRVVLADDQDLVRVGLRIILESEDGIDVVGEARTGREAVELVGALQPDVVCMDVQMPDLDGLAATRELIAAGTRAGILILTTFNRDDYLFEALEAGASGFVLKNSSPEDLVAAVQVIARGDALLSPDVTRRVIESFTSRPPAQFTEATPAATASGAATAAAPPAAAALADLTEREREVLELLAAGRSNSEIAGELYLGEATVKTHVSKILQKLGLRDRIQAVVFAYENGIAVPGRS